MRTQLAGACSIVWELQGTFVSFQQRKQRGGQLRRCSRGSLGGVGLCRRPSASCCRGQELAMASWLQQALPCTPVFMGPVRHG